MKLKKLLNTFFRDKYDNIAIWQFPNLPLMGWFVCRLATFIVEGRLGLILGYAGTAFLIVWACLEITQGVSHFRRAVGWLILFITIVSNVYPVIF